MYIFLRVCRNVNNTSSVKSCLVFTKLRKYSDFTAPCSALKCYFCMLGINTDYIVPLRTITTECQTGNA